jgi:microcystin degradation protein MlrC
MKTPRIGLVGFFLECNRWAPVTTADVFSATFDFAGDALASAWQSTSARVLPDTLGFVRAMQAAGAWQPVPLRMAGAQPGGPADHAWFETFLEDVRSRLVQAGPLDAVFVSMHGAALTTQSDDPDGDFLQLLREHVGPHVPVVAVLDLHTNLSDRMTQALSGLVAYRTNPHNDLAERGAEAAALLLGMLHDGPGVVEKITLPLLAAATSQLIGPDTVYGQLVARAQAHVQGDVLNVSLCGGFALADAPKCGFSVAVTARHGQRTLAAQTAYTLAGMVWAERARFVSHLTPMTQAVALATAAGQPGQSRIILADVGDNPGGGGSGNTTALLHALLQARAQDVLLGVFTDPALAQEAHALGLGARFDAHFNRCSAGAGPGVQALVWPAQVLALASGEFTGRRGLVKGTAGFMGLSALLLLDGVRVAVISLRQQLLDPAQLDVLGVDLDTVQTLVVKSRGHFRAAFDAFTSEDRMVEVDTPGLTTPNLSTLPWTRLPRPIYPLEEDTLWPH